MPLGYQTALKSNSKFKVHHRSKAASKSHQIQSQTYYYYPSVIILGYDKIKTLISCRSLPSGKQWAKNGIWTNGRCSIIIWPLDLKYSFAVQTIRSSRAHRKKLDSNRAPKGLDRAETRQHCKRGQIHQKRGVHINIGCANSSQGCKNTKGVCT